MIVWLVRNKAVVALPSGKGGSLKLSKRQKWTVVLCLATIGCWAVCAYLMYLGLPGARWVFIDSALLAVVALGIHMREWPFSFLFKDEVVVKSLPNQLAPEAPAYLRGSGAKKVRDRLWQAFASVRLRHRQVQVPTVVEPVVPPADPRPVSAVVRRVPAPVEVVHRPS